MVQGDLFSAPFPLNILDANAYMFKDGFREYIAENLHVFSAFAKQAKYVRNVMRRDHYSCRTIGEYLRHNSALKEKGSGFKLNNDQIPDISRLLMLSYPELDGLFEKRCR